MSADDNAARLNITAVVMTLNEERNLRECLESVVPYVRSTFVVDCGSSDGTEAIARAFGCSWVHHAFKNHADQFQWALDKLPFTTEWVVRVDADERWTADGFAALAPVLVRSEVGGVNVRMRIMFMGRWLKHGGLYPNNFLRVFRRAGASIERRWMDEHIRVDGLVVSPGIDVVEANYDRQHNIGLWTTKHNFYSTREAIDFLIIAHRLRPHDTIADLVGGRTARKRWFKENVYLRTPLFARPFLYFIYRYVLRLGFLDGVPGFIFAVLQAFWYRFLVDTKIFQLEREAQSSRRSLPEVVKDGYGIDI